MEQRVTLMTLSVADLAHSRRFYEEGLGWQPGFTDGEIVFYQLNGVVLALWERSAYEAEVHPDGQPSGIGGLGLAQNFRSKEAVDAAFAQALAAGATTLRQPRDMPFGGYSGSFADPDGHPWEIAWNPGWTLDADGNVTMDG